MHLKDPRRRRRRMAKANGRPRGRPPHKNSKAAPSEPGDEQGAGTHAELIRMNNRFRTRLLRAFKRGKENCQAAAAMYDVKPVAPVRSASHVIARATSWATRCTRPSPRSLRLIRPPAARGRLALNRTAPCARPAKPPAAGNRSIESAISGHRKHFGRPRRARETGDTSRRRGTIS